MEKFLSIPAATGNQLVSATNIVSVFAGTFAVPSATSTATTILYQGGKTVTLTTSTGQVASNMRNAIQDAITLALQTSWTNVVYVVPPLPISVSSIVGA
jgi:hypothetical protein